ncbi:MAG TPA: hypothetical protein PLW10_15135, partial [Myxococcota bacterium]|nr:hypothetical protein [Myxococcota bacterium]
MGRRRRRFGASRLLALGLTALLPAIAVAGAPDLGWLAGELGQVLHVQGMTFVASEGASNEILVRATRARFYPARQVADLEEVEVEVTPADDRVGFSMRCDAGRLNLATEGFVAEGHVAGSIEGGRTFEALWVAYDEVDGVLYTDEPVLIVDQGGRYRGGGFRYFVRENRFRLQGG